MNYRHIYHAGNFADIIKHIILIILLEELKKKDKSFSVLDAFAGTGLYDLESMAAKKTAESEQGIKRITSLISDSTIPASIQILFNIITTLKENYYPGSPFIIHQLLRFHDKLIACELHSEDYLSLKQLFIKNNKQKKIDIYNMDAYQAIKAFLPFKEKRGLIFLDPPFEVKNEFSKLLEALQIIKSRALNLCTLIWYPIKDKNLVRNFYENFKIIGFKESLILEYELSNTSKNMMKCGLLIVNPPNIKTEIDHVINYFQLTNSSSFNCFYV